MLFVASISYADENVNFDEIGVNISELGLPTVNSITELKTNADALWEEQNYKEAAIIYAELSLQANWIANIIASECEPFYSASPKDKEEFA